MAIGRLCLAHSSLLLRALNLMGSNRATDARYVSVFSDSTSFGPSAAMPMPLMIGPRMIPMLVVLCSKALPAVKCCAETRCGIEADKDGVKTAEATPYRKTKR